ncbi:MAG: adenylate/guanylate cyclase domain-containing protein [Alphaproteobacteria bacterium]
MTDAPALPRRRARLSIIAVLSLALGGLVLLGMGGALILGLGGARRSTAILLRERIELAIDLVAARIDRHLQPVEDQSAAIAKIIAERPELLDQQAVLAEILTGALAATPQVNTIGVVRSDYRAMRLVRGAERFESADVSNITGIIAGIERVRQSGYGSWSEPVLSRLVGQPVIAYRYPIFVGGEFRGAVLSVVTIAELSEFARDAMNDLGYVAFVLYGDDRILAHPLMSGFRFEPSGEAPLPPLAVNFDPVLAEIWSNDRKPLTASAPLLRSEGHLVELANDYYGYFYRRLGRYGDTPWLAGIYASGKDVGGEVRRFWWLVYSGGALLALALAGAAMVGQRLARPIRELAAHARRIQSFEIENGPPLQRSRVREIDEAVTAFNAMTQAMRWFSTYIPRALTDRLVRTGRATPTRERRLTVMFTDIAGFSRLAETMPAPKIAALLNEHFAIIGEAIEATGGTIDKYIGDAVMAFWGAPDRQQDHARRAYTASQLIVERLAAWNGERRARGLVPVRLRIGLHSGRMLVGNIGFSGRVNYTVVGDPVNVAQRIEQTGKTVDDGGDVIVLASADTLARIGIDVPHRSLGKIALSGRDGQIEIVRLF